MFIVDPVKVAQAVGLNPNTPNGLDDGMLRSILDCLKPTLEGALNVRTLDYGTNVDTFDLPCSRWSIFNAPRSLLLTNAFLDLESVVVTDPRGNVVTDPLLIVDDYYGVIILPNWMPGRYTVKYDSGFAPDKNAVAKNAPEFFLSAVTGKLILWLRTNLVVPKIPLLKSITLDSMLEPLQRNVSSAIYSNYMRPRVDIVYPMLHKREE